MRRHKCAPHNFISGENICPLACRKVTKLRGGGCDFGTLPHFPFRAEMSPSCVLMTLKRLRLWYVIAQPRRSVTKLRRRNVTKRCRRNASTAWKMFAVPTFRRSDSERLPS